MYLMYANTYITAKNSYYGMDICPAYWEWLDYQYTQGQVASIQIVYDELLKGGDELSHWIKDRKNHFLTVTDAATQQRYAEIIQHIYELPEKKPSNVANFADGADPWLIAKASVTGAIVFTQEKRDPDNSKRIKIPNICNDFGVRYIGSFELLKALQARFILQI